MPRTSSSLLSQWTRRYISNPILRKNRPGVLPTQPSFRFSTVSMSEAQPEAVAAAFTHGLDQQIAHFEKYGYVVVKGQRNKTDVMRLQKETMEFFDQRKSTWGYSWWRFWHKVSTAKNRHSIPLIPSELVMSVLNSTVGRNRQLFEEFLPQNSPCVELSSMISLPGSERQDTHSDISFNAHDLVITGFVALSDVTLECGPTHLHPGTHTSAFHRTCTRVYQQRSLPSYDGWDGDFLQMDASLSPFPETETKEATEAAAAAQQAAPVFALLDAGDLLLFDTKIFHYGSANESKQPRALLAFSFQRPLPNGGTDKIEGFTYHCHKEARGRFQLDSFTAPA